MKGASHSKIRRYIDLFLTRDLIGRVRDYSQWPELEDVIGELYFGLTSFFCPPEYKRIPSKELHPPLPLSPRQRGTAPIRYLAVNFRGLYQRNGRETIIAPFGKLRRLQNNVERHRSLHEAYLQLLSRKTGSINQLFLANTTLKSISVCFRNGSASHVILENKWHARFDIGKDVSTLWKSELVAWQEQALAFLTSRNGQALEKLRESLVSSRQSVLQRITRDSARLVGTAFYRDWYRLPHVGERQVTKASAVETVERFEQWLRSLCWLSFHCNPKHAGPFFYSVRLPQLLRRNVKPFPHSSVSIVSKTELSLEFRSALCSFPKALKANTQFKKLCAHATEVFTAFEALRHQNNRTGAEGDLAKFISPLSDKQNELTVDYRKVDFLIRMARLLVGQCHEGHPLHFCLIFGFSSERINSESKGLLREVVSELHDQWKRFERKVIVRSIAKKLRPNGRQFIKDIEGMLDGELSKPILALFADGMAKWIKTGDLPLQLWNTALFLEEIDTKPWPIPTSIVRISSANGSQNESIATEHQLRKTLKQLTELSRSTVAVIIGDTGLILFALGNSILVPATAGTSYDNRFSEIRLWGTRVDTDKFKEFLIKLTSKGAFARVLPDTCNRACEMIVDLCEALVTLGYGALIVIRISGGSRRNLPPLNPVWRVEPGKTSPNLRDGVLLYACMAALDGATEICLPQGKGSISFAVRKSVLPTKKVWRYDKEDDAILSKEFIGIDPIGLVGKGTRHHNALAFSADHKDDIILTVSADGPVTVWQAGSKVTPEGDAEYQPRFKP